MIRAIETQYKGYKFRSRLEARWAVYFDHVGIKWEYEIEGYDLDGVRYLPDFWLPLYRLWAEVKPGPFTGIELEKARRLQKATHHDVLLLVGIPEAKLYETVCGDGYGLVRYKGSLFDSTQICLDYSDLPYVEWPDDYKKVQDDFIFSFDEVQQAIMAARSMRFWYGGLR